MHERIRDITLAAWGRSVASHPRITLAICLALAAGSIYWTATSLEFRADRSKLIDPDKPWNRQYAAYKEHFPRYHDVLVVLDGDAGDRRIDELARSIAGRLRADARIDAADAGFDVSTAGPRFYRAAPPEEFAAALDELADARRLAAAENANAGLGLLLAELGRDEDDPGALDRLERFLDPYISAAQGREPRFDFLEPDQSRWQPLASKDGTGRLRFVRVHLHDASRGVNLLGQTLTWLRQTVDEIVGASDLPGVEWGVTGIPAIESDETTEAIRGSTVASLLAIGLITMVMFVAFRGLRVPLLAAGALLIGMAWSFGWLMLSTGHLQILSVVFSVILLGMGIDFALLFVSRLELVRDEHADLPSATARVYRRMGPGMVTGAVTTAAAFAATALTDFRGMAEMGTIAAGGILLCLAAVLSAFPALLALTGRWKSIVRHRPGGETAHFARGRIDFVDAHPVATLAVAVLLVAGLVAAALRVGYDPNVLNLQASGIESVLWQQRIEEEDETSVWSAVVLATPGRAPEIVTRLQRVDTVSRVGGMGTLFPENLDERVAMIAEVRQRPVAAAEAQPGLDATLSQLAAVRLGLRRRSGAAPPDLRPRIEAITASLESAIRAGAQLDPAAGEAAWERLDSAFVEARGELAAWTAAALADVPPSAADLPPVLRRYWVGRDGSWLLRVNPVAGEAGHSVLDPERLNPFVESLKATLAGTGLDVIGAPVQIYESSELIKREYIKAACYAVAAILVLLFIDFRRLADALCAMAPVTVGFVGAFGVMGLTGVPLNFANIIVLPIIFGIGVNAGVQVVHRWRQEPHGMPKGLSGGTGRGITLTMMTTMIGFGCLTIAEHRGIRSLGFVMVVGLGVTLLACYTVLPAVLRLRGEAAAAAAGEVFEREQREAVKLRRSA